MSRQEDGVRHWIRGVNVGGWLLMERFVTPYMFAITSCHLEGNFCWYPGQVSAPPHRHNEYCDLSKCEPHLIDSVLGGKDFPTDEYTLAKSFPTKALAKEYLTYHWDNFVTKHNVKAMKEAGVTHVRVPLPHWIMGDIRDDEPWIDGGQWLYFVRFVGWCREYQIEVWPDVHTAPGSQNGFDNSGQLLKDYPTCKHWTSSEDNVQRSLKAIKDISEAIMRDNLRDVVTGFGVLNEPFQDCGIDVIRSFNNDALATIRNTMGDNTSVYIGDSFDPTGWNDGWWAGEEYSGTYLDSHYYHVFAETTRALSPKQHIALVCQENTRDTNSCCFEDYPENTKPVEGISRIIGEWSASYDTLVIEKLNDVMKGIEENATAPELDRKISKERQVFLRNFVEAQMVAFESKDVGASSGWFFWTMKTEGGAFAEWDFLRGIREGWIPTIPGDTSVSSESLYGTCREIAQQTKDDVSIVNEFPDPNHLADGEWIWIGPSLDDDYVVSHAGIFKEDNGTTDNQSGGDDEDNGTEKADDNKPAADHKKKPNSTNRKHIIGWFPLVVGLGVVVYGIRRVFFGGGKNIAFGDRAQYTNLDEAIHKDQPTSLHV